MSSRLAIKYKAIDGITVVELIGVINEDNDLASITDNVDTPSAIIHTGDLERINSCGVRDWVNWLETLHNKGCAAYFVECSPAIMTQVNLVNNFLGKGHILSFYAPYFCPSCEADKMLLINVEDAKKETPARAPACRCDQCDHTMEFDDIESSYFAFLDTIKQPTIDPAIVSAAQQASQASVTLRSRASSMQLPALTTTPSGPSISLPTTPNSKELYGLLTNVGEVETAAPESPRRSSGVLVYLIVGMLVVAIGLLAYVALR